MKEARTKEVLQAEAIREAEKDARREFHAAHAAEQAAAAEERARRVPKPSDDWRRYRTGRGRAHFENPRDAALDEIVEAFPELVAARQAWLDENAKGEELEAAEKAALGALAPLCVPSQIVRASGVPIDAFEAAHAAYEAAQRATIAQARRALAALKRFDDLSFDAETRSERIAVASTVAAAHHATAVAAWKTLREALDARDLAHKAAASPGRHWSTSLHEAPTYALHGAESYYKARVDGFDLDALTQEA
jgi:hypothetical protein